MTLALPDDAQAALARGVADFVADAFPVGRFRSGAARDVERWGELAALGIPAIGVAEADGGLGLTAVEQALVARELGRVLLSPAYVAAMLAPQVAMLAGQGGLRDALLSGARTVGIALGTRDGEARVADGDGPFLLVEGDRLSLIEAGHRPLASIDETVRLSAAALPGTVLAQVEAPDLALTAQLIAAGFLVGLLETARDGMVEQARTRVQFGRPIGAFQAIKHRCADVALGAEMAWSLLWSAANAVAADAPDAAFQARSVKWLAGDEALKAARFDIQAHGGMGFTQEVDAQLILKRAHVLNQMFGDPRAVPAALAALHVEV